MSTLLMEKINSLGSEVIIKSCQSGDIEKSEKTLGISFDDSLKKYLSEFGAISFRSMELCGLGYPLNSYRNIVPATEQARADWGIPNDAVLLEDVGEGHVVLYQMSQGVFYWGNGRKLDKIDNDIEDYVSRRIKEES